MRAHICGADGSTLEPIEELLNAHSASVRSVGFPRDAAKVFSSSWDYAMKLWGERASLMRVHLLSAVVGGG